MGVMRFRVPDSFESGEWDEAGRAYLAGYDGRVFPARVDWDGRWLELRRPVADSGMFHVPWPVPGFGTPVLTTSSLSEREEPYLLPVELARGKLSLLRDQLATWKQGGLTIPDGFDERYRLAHTLFQQAACAQLEDEDRASDFAQQSLVQTLTASDLLTAHYARIRLQVRTQRTSTLAVALGTHMGQGEPTAIERELIPELFSTAFLPIEWKRIEPREGEYDWTANDAQVLWASMQQRLFFCGGPLLDLSAGGLPGWLRDWDHDFFNLQSFVCDFVETAIRRYLKEIRRWEVAARANTGGALNLTEENRLNLVARALEVARAVDQDIQLDVRVDRPFSDYQARGSYRLTAWQFVDALCRMGAGLSAVHLEFAIGYGDDGCDSRDLLELSRCLDQWSLLGLPLFVTLAFPSRSGRDPKATLPRPVGNPCWSDEWNSESQARWLDAYLPVVLAKQSVVAAYWSHLSDATPHDYAHAGLIDAEGQPKPAFETLRAIKNIYWPAATIDH